MGIKRVPRGYDSDSSNGNKRGDFSYLPPDGWRVVPGSAKLVIDLERPRQSRRLAVDFIRDTPAPAYHVETDHHGLGTSGKLKFHIEFDVTRTVQKEVWTPKDVNISWGSFATFAAGGNAWKASFDTFEGEHQEYSGPAIHRCLNVVPEGTNVRIRVPAAYQVKMYRL
jgi:hypothetical protein